MSPTISKLAAALLQAQSTMGNAIKDAKNPFFKSTYADLNSIREAAIPALNAARVVVLQPVVSIGADSFVRTLLMHESGEFLASDTRIVTAKANDPQAYGSAISYARRYGLQSMLNIGAVDDDAESSTSRNKPNNYTAPVVQAVTTNITVPTPSLTSATVDAGAEVPPTPLTSARRPKTFKKSTNGAASPVAASGDNF